MPATTEGKPNVDGEYEMRLLPAFAVSVPLVQVFIALLGLAILMPVGKVSLNANDDTALALAVLSMLNVKVDRSPSDTDAGLNDLLNPGRSVVTVKSAVALPLLPALEVRSPDVLVCVPGVALVTLVLTVQL